MKTQELRTRKRKRQSSNLKVLELIYQQEGQDVVLLRVSQNLLQPKAQMIKLSKLGQSEAKSQKIILKIKLKMVLIALELLAETM